MDKVHAVPGRGWLILIAVAVAVAAVIGINRAAPAAAAEAPPMTAVEIADGVLFNTGPAAEYLTSLNRGETQWSEDLWETQERVHHAIEGDRLFASSFQERMQSGDPRQVDAAMFDLGELLRDVLYEQYTARMVDEALAQVELDWVEEEIIRGAIVDAEFASYEGMNVWLETAVAAVAVVVAVVAVAAFWVLKEIPSEHTDLAQEVILNDIAAGLEAGF
jgi:hypothetical protein